MLVSLDMRVIHQFLQRTQVLKIRIQGVRRPCPSAIFVRIVAEKSDVGRFDKVSGPFAEVECSGLSPRFFEFFHHTPQFISFEKVKIENFENLA